MELSEKDLKEIEDRIIFLETKFNLEESKKRMEELQKETEASDFWSDTEKAKEVSQELKEIKEDIETINYFKKEINDLKDFLEILEEGSDLEKEFEERFFKLRKDVLKKEIELNFTGKYDSENAVFTIMAGAGGKEAEDWALMLLRMYQRYFEKKGFNAIILDELLGEGNEGIKTVTLEVKGKYAYGYLRRESGVHRLVRLSPFSAQNLRHTSFALVDVLPVIKESESVKINPEDLRVDYFRAIGTRGIC
jgi:peptide chain release factor 2